MLQQFENAKLFYEFERVFKGFERVFRNLMKNIQNTGIIAGFCLGFKMFDTCFN